MEILHTYPTMTDVTKVYGISMKTLKNCINSKKELKGFLWDYKI